MSKLGRLIALLMILALPAGLFAHVAQAGDMASMLAPVGMDQPMPDDCNTCGKTDMGQVATCSFVCVANPALMPASFALDTAPQDATVSIPQAPGAGLSAPPDPYPPRSLAL